MFRGERSLNHEGERSSCSVRDILSHTFSVDINQKLNMSLILNCIVRWDWTLIDTRNIGDIMFCPPGGGVFMQLVLALFCLGSPSSTWDFEKI